MKRLAVITTSLLFALTAFGGITAFAADSGTIYPENSDFIKTLTFSNLDDYEVDGDTYYFAEEQTLFTYKDGELSKEPLEETQFGPPQTTISIDTYTYTIIDGTLKVADFSDGNEQIQTLGAYSNLKRYDDIVYAVKNNVLYSFDGAQAEKVVLKYSDYSETQKILVGQAADSLKNYQSLTFVNVAAGAYMTSVDLASLENAYFISGETVIAEEETVALLLCYTGVNAAIISIGDTSYVLNRSNVKETPLNCFKEPEFANATIVGNRIYASPFTVTGTTLLPNAAGTKVKINFKLECEVLNSAYYQIVYKAADGVTDVIGYVAEGFLTEYIIEDNKQPAVIPDPEHSEKTDTRTVLLIIAVVILVLAAAGYLTFVATSDKRKNKDKDKPKKEKKNKKDKTENQETEQKK